MQSVPQVNVLAQIITCVICMGGSRGGQGVRPFPLEYHKLLYVSLEILERTPFQKQLDPLGPVASRGRFVRSSVKYIGDLNKSYQCPSSPVWIGIFWLLPWYEQCSYRIYDAFNIFRKVRIRLDFRQNWHKKHFFINFSFNGETPMTRQVKMSSQYPIRLQFYA